MKFFKQEFISSTKYKQNICLPAADGKKWTCVKIDPSKKIFKMKFKLFYLFFCFFVSFHYFLVILHLIWRLQKGFSSFFADLKIFNVMYLLQYALFYWQNSLIHLACLNAPTALITVSDFILVPTKNIKHPCSE